MKKRYHSEALRERKRIPFLFKATISLTELSKRELNILTTSHPQLMTVLSDCSLMANRKI